MYSTNSDSTPSISKKRLFNKVRNMSVHFDASNESSFESVQNDKSDTDLELVPKKKKFFTQRARKSKNYFNVEFHESISTTENGHSDTCSEVKQLFRQKNNLDGTSSFNISLHESRGSTSQKDNINSETVDTDTDSSAILRKNNQFKKKQNKIQNYSFNIDFEETKNGSLDPTVPLPQMLFNNVENNTDPLKDFDVSQTQLNDLDSTFSNKLSQEDENKSMVASKKNFFKRPTTNTVKNIFDVEFAESTLCDDSEVVSESRSVFKKQSKPSGNFEVSFNNTSVGKNTSRINNSKTSVLVDKDSTKECSSSEGLLMEEPNILQESINKSENVRFEPSKENLNITRRTETFTTSANENSEMFLNQSSYNDENLNNWMSDQSDEEINPPLVPDIRTNVSFHKNILEVSNKTATENNVNLGSWEEKAIEIVSKAKTNYQKEKNSQTIKIKKLMDNKEIKNVQQENTYKPPRLRKPTSYATKRLYQFIIKKIKPKYGLDTNIQAEELVSLICDVVKIVSRRKVHQKKKIQELKKALAVAGVIETTIDFYEFVIKFLPYNFRVKVVPSVQPVTNSVFPPKDTLNPFEKIV